MKRFATIVAAMALTLGAAAQVPSPLNIAGKGFPQVNKDKSVTFKVMAPAGYEENLDKRYPVLYLQHGGSEPEGMYAGIKAFHDLLEENGINHTYFESPGTGHEWLTWRRSLHQFAQMIFK